MKNESFKNLIVNPLLKKLNFNLKFIEIKKLGKERNIEDWISWMKQSTQELYLRVKSFLSDENRHRFDSLKRSSNRV